MDDEEVLQAPVIEAQTSPESDIEDIPLAKRRKTAPPETSTREVEANVPVPARARVPPRRPARRGKTAQPLAAIPELESSTSKRKNPTRNDNGALSKTKEVAGENEQLGTKKGEAIASDESDADADESRLLEGVAGEGMVGDDHGDVVAAGQETVKKVAKRGK